MACLTCFRNNRTCDRQSPVCRACRIAWEPLCCWPTNTSMTTREVYLAPHDHENSKSLLDFISLKWSKEHPVYDRFFGDARCLRSLEVDSELQRIFETSHRHISSPGPTQGLLAVAALILMKRSNELQPAAIRFCNSAIATITTLNLSQSTLFSEDFLRTIVLLNLYERYNPPSSIPRRLHFKGLVQALPFLQDDSIPAPGYVPHCILESLIYHVTIASTFSWDELGNLPFDYIDRIIVYKCNTSVLPAKLGCNFAVFGVPVTLLSMAFKASFLRQKSVLDENDTIRAYTLLTQLQDTSDSPPLVCGPFIYQHLLTELWMCACKVLLSKIMETSLTPRDSVISTTVREAMLIARAGDPQLSNITILWPLTILCFATRNAREYQVFRTPLAQLDQVTDSTCVEILLGFLDANLHQASNARRGATFDMLLNPTLPGLLL